MLKDVSDDINKFEIYILIGKEYLLLVWFILNNLI